LIGVLGPRESNLKGFSLGAKLRQGEMMGLFYRDTEQVKMIASKACFAGWTLLGMRDRLPKEPE
jgi:hypothetical protein